MFDLLLSHNCKLSCIEDKILCLEIENTGGWVHENNESRTGIKNVAERLTSAYPGNCTFDIEKGGKIVRVSISISFVIRTANGKVYIDSKTMSEWENRLPQNHFLLPI